MRKSLAAATYHTHVINGLSVASIDERAAEVKLKLQGRLFQTVQESIEKKDKVARGADIRYSIQVFHQYGTTSLFIFKYRRIGWSKLSVKEGSADINGRQDAAIVAGNIKK